MTLVSRFSACLLVALMTISVGAQASRRRVVSPANETGPTTLVHITATDASNGIAIASATVAYAGRSQTTDGNGQATLNLPIGKPASVLLSHIAFEPSVQSITAQVGGSYELKLTEKPSVTIKLNTGATRIVDIGTAQFAYAPIFQNTVRTDYGNFCKEDGSDFTPDKSAFTRILGPAVPASAPQCCQNGNVMSANVEMKTGGKFKVYFKDNCAGNEVDFAGREKSTGLFQYFRFTDIAEIDFP